MNFFLQKHQSRNPLFPSDGTNRPCLYRAFLLYLNYRAFQIKLFKLYCPSVTKFHRKGKTKTKQVKMNVKWSTYRSTRISPRELICQKRTSRYRMLTLRLIFFVTEGQKLLTGDLRK